MYTLKIEGWSWGYGDGACVGNLEHADLCVRIAGLDRHGEPRKAKLFELEDFATRGKLRAWKMTGETEWHFEEVK